MISVLVVGDKILTYDTEKSLIEDQIFIQITKSTTGALEKLQTTLYDAIIYDHYPCDIDVIKFLKTIRSQNFDIPFIIFIEEDEDEIAIDALKNGADFYIKKRDFQRWRSRELSQLIQIFVEKKTALKALNEKGLLYGKSEKPKNKSRELQQILIDNPLEGILILDFGGNILYANQAALKMYGVKSLKNLIGMNIYATVDRKCHDFVRMDQKLVNADKGGFLANYKAIRANGETIWVEGLGTKVTYQGQEANIVFIRDITDKKRIYDDKKLLLDNVEAKVWYLTNPETYGAVNKTFAEFYKIPKDEVKGKKLKDILDDNSAEVCIAENRDTFETKQKVKIERWMTNANGERRAFSIIKTPKLDHNGNVEHVVCVAVDITEQKQYMAALKESEERLNLAIEGGNLGIWDWNIATNELILSKSVANMLGWPPKEKIVRIEEWKQWVHPMDLPYLEYALRAHLAGETPYYESELRLDNKHKNPIWLRTRGKITSRDDAGRPKRVTGIFQDITKQKKAKGELAKRDCLLAAAAISAHQLQIAVDYEHSIEHTLENLGLSTGSDYVFIFENVDDIETGQHLMNHSFGWSLETLNFERNNPVFREINYDIIKLDFYDMLSSGENTEITNQRFMKIIREFSDETIQFQSILIIPIIIEDIFWGFICFGNCHEKRTWNESEMDILSVVAESIGGTIIRHKMNIMLQEAQHDLETKIKKRTKELEAKNAEMERFAYTVSHDLRSPLFTIQGFIGFLKEDIAQGNEKDVAEYIKMIENATVKMDLLLKDTLELSRIGRVANPPEKVPFEEIVQETLAQSSEKIKLSNAKVHVSDNWPTIYVDRSRIVEVLANLVENSIKYARNQGSPQIEIGWQKDGNKAVFFVRDNGIGIDPSQHDKVFNLFYKVENNTEGTGAGLAIVKRIIEVHNGHIWIESEVKKGCKVNFTLPIASGLSCE